MDAPTQGPAPGATVHEDGATFAIRSRHASRVELCLFDPDDPQRELARHDLSSGERSLWWTDVADVGAGALYGYRVHGANDRARGHRFDADRLLVDPWARALSGPRGWHPDHQRPGDTAPTMPRAVAVDPTFDWQGDRPPNVPWSDTVIYEAHVKGLTAAHPDVPAADRGRFLGLAHPAIVDHLQRLGVTSLQLLPVQASYDEPHLVQRGLTNYWGYAPLALAAPDARFASDDRGAQVAELQEAIRRLHAAGIEVLLDVVFNHTAEGNDGGPTLSLRGLDNASYYRLHPTDPSRGVDWTGCGNTLDLRDPLTRALVLDSLRRWVREFHVDGFRFDLGVTLDRGPGFLDALAADPELRHVKLITEPWDLGPDGYRLGRFAAPWVEWNDRFRNTARRTWRGDPGSLPDFATRLVGSSDVFDRDRGPTAGINYVACHDGFTLRDVTSFRTKRNAANGEENRDGTDANYSEPWGPEGPTEDPDVLRQRDQAARNLLASAALAQGVPMICHGDERGRSQRGNNNAYCQDGPLTWIDWTHDPRAEALEAFTAAVFAVRRQHPSLRRTSFLTGEADDAGQRDAVWLRPDGRELHGKEWAAADGVALRLGPVGEDPPLLLLLNPSARPLTFRLPADTGWFRVLDSADVECPLSDEHAIVHERSLLLLSGT